MPPSLGQRITLASTAVVLRWNQNFSSTIGTTGHAELTKMPKGGRGAHFVCANAGVEDETPRQIFWRGKGHLTTR
eukprot:scaffold6279_cov418-Prasinococcus_capsulatus_cf.AAC.11